MKSKVDVVVIGAGIGGLITANFLQKMGKKVLLLESSKTVGGYLSGFSEKNFSFNAGCQSFPSGGIFFPLLRELDVRGVRFVRARHRIRTNKIDLGVLESWAKVEAQLIQSLPREKIAIQAFCQDVEKMTQVAAFFSKESSQYRIVEGRQRWQRFCYHYLGLARYYSLLKQCEGYFVPDWVARYFSPESLLYPLFVQPFYEGSPVLCLPWTWHAWMRDYWVEATSFAHFTNELASLFMRHGGRLELSCEASHIEVRGGRVCQVVDEQSREFQVGAVVLSSDLKKGVANLFGKGALPEEFVNEVKGGEVSESFLSVYLGVDVPRDQIAAKLGAYNTFYFPEHFLCDPHDIENPDLFARCWVEITHLSALGSHFAPPGKSALVLQTLAVPEWQEGWAGGKGKKYEQLKQSCAQALIKTAEEILPGLSERIVVMRVATPLTKAAWTQNTGGATAGWSYRTKQPLFLEGQDFAVETPLPNFFIGSQWALRLGGVASAACAAKIVAQKILKS